MTDSAATPLVLTLKPGHMRAFHPLLERGVVMDTQVNVSVNSLLLDGLGLTLDDLDAVQTIFLDSKPVDDLDGSLVKDNAVVALSAAMPGLMGATMRRAGTYASLRSSISHASDADGSIPPAPGHVTLKLFNHMLDRLAGHILAQGVTVRGKDLASILAPLPQTLLPAEPRAEIKGQTLDLAQFELGLPESSLILLTVRETA